MIESATTTRLQIATLEDFDWMIASEPSTFNGLHLPPGGIDEPEVLLHVRDIAARLQERSCFATWMMLVGNEVVGLCGFHEPPVDGIVEIGYNGAPSRRRRGYATQAVAAMIAHAIADGAIIAIRAETNVENVASQRALVHNDFVRVGKRHDEDDGELICWRKDLIKRA